MYKTILRLLAAGYCLTVNVTVHTCTKYCSRNITLSLSYFVMLMQSNVIVVSVIMCLRVVIFLFNLKGYVLV